MYQGILVIIVIDRNGITAVHGQRVNGRKVAAFVFQHDIKYIFSVLQHSIAARRDFCWNFIPSENIRIQSPSARGNGHFVQKKNAVCCMIDKHKDIRSVYRSVLYPRDCGDGSIDRNIANRRPVVVSCGSNRSSASADRRHLSVCNRRNGRHGTRPRDALIRRIVRQNGRRQRFAFADFQSQRRFIEGHGRHLDNLNLR